MRTTVNTYAELSFNEKKDTDNAGIATMRNFVANTFSSLVLFSLLFLHASVSCGSEVDASKNIYTPIVHQPFFKGERELLGYNPKYFPNTISFDETNSPYIRTYDGFIQTLNAKGEWERIDFKPAIKKEFPNWDGKLLFGPFSEERIVFDAEGDAYMHVQISRRTPNAKSLIMYSKDHCRTWTINTLPKKFTEWFVKIEESPPFRRLPTPPAFSIMNGNSLYIMLPVKKNGKLELPVPVLISNSVFAIPTHSGGGNFTATVPGKSFVVYASSIPQAGKHGTSQFITVFDHASKTCSPRVFLGNNGHNKPDPHNIPAILLDSHGYLHAILGSHADPFVYLRSLKPYDITQWTPPEKLGYKSKMAEGSYTYIGVLCDSFDNLHLTARWSGDGYKNRLIYMKKPFKKSWLPQKILVEPFKSLYSVYYHKMGQDLLGRIFINYSYYGNELTESQVLAYDKKWPEEHILGKEGKPKPRPNGFWYKVKYHDPVMLLSNDSGDSFRLALTEDFAAGRITLAKTENTEQVNSIGMPMVRIHSGSFIMGSVNGDKDEKPLRPTTISKDFLLGKFPVRVRDFAEFVKTTKYKTQFERTKNKKLLYNWCGGGFAGGDDRIWSSPGIPQTENDPVVMLTVVDINAFCEWLSKKEGAKYRLPTEAEWEYACRAGSITEYFFGADNSVLPRYAWYKNNATGTKPVGVLLPNNWGLYDMNGNVWEYCADYYHPYRSDLPIVDPLEKQKSVSGRVIRGGSWIDDVHGDRNGFNLRSATRYYMVYPLMQTDWVGFRVVKEIENKK